MFQQSKRSRLFRKDCGKAGCYNYRGILVTHQSQRKVIQHSSFKVNSIRRRNYLGSGEFQLHNCRSCMRFEVLTLVKMSVLVFWLVMPCELVGIGGT